jgi:hypothetical protein
MEVAGGCHYINPKHAKNSNRKGKGKEKADDSIKGSGYPKIRIDGFNYSLHKLVLVAHGHRPELALGLKPQVLPAHVRDLHPQGSHLCHDRECGNYKHLCIESQAENRARQHCAGPPTCTHIPPCLRKA